MNGRELLLVIAVGGGLILTLAVFGDPPLQAGAPPPEVIPWDSVWVLQSQAVVKDAAGNERMVAKGRFVHFITREKYMVEVWGQSKAAKVDELEYELEQIKAAIKARKDK